MLNGILMINEINFLIVILLNILILFQDIIWCSTLKYLAFYNHQILKSLNTEIVEPLNFLKSCYSYLKKRIIFTSTHYDILG